MIEFISFPSCQNPYIPASLFGLMPGGAILIVTTCLMVFGNGKWRLYGIAGFFLGLLVSLAPILDRLNASTFCPVTATNIAHFGIEVYLANLSATVLCFGLIYALYLAVRHDRHQNSAWTRD